MKSDAMKILLADLDHSYEETEVFTRIKPVPPKSEGILGGYLLSIITSLVGLLVAFFFFLHAGMLIVFGGLALAANTWKRKDNSNIRTARSVLVKDDVITLSHGFQARKLVVDDVVDISLKSRSENGQHQVQIYFNDKKGQMHESLIFFGTFKQSLIEKGNRVADYLWAEIKAERTND